MSEQTPAQIAFETFWKEYVGGKDNPIKEFAKMCFLAGYHVGLDDGWQIGWIEGLEDFGNNT